MVNKKKATQEEIPFGGPPATMDVSSEPQNDEEIPPPEAPMAAAPTAVATKPRASQLAIPMAAESEVVQRVTEAIETLSSFNNMQLPLIRFKEGFKLNELDDEVEAFEGIIVYTKESNVYYEGRFKAGEVSRPDCFAPDGRVPLASSPKRQSETCATCPQNQFGSSKQGDGKACKNIRPLFVLVKSPESDEAFPYGIIPKVLRVPPTSLSLIKSYMTGVAADFGAIYNIRTKFTVFQKAQNQTHYNIKFAPSGKLTAQDKANAVEIRNRWMKVMAEGNFGLDDEVHQAGEAPKAPAAGSGVDHSTRF